MSALQFADLDYLRERARRSESDRRASPDLLSIARECGARDYRQLGADGISIEFYESQLAAFAALIRAEALEEAAQIADSLRDDREERRAHVASNMRDGNISDQLRSLKHHQTVTMWNTALRKTAAAIRNLSSASTPSATGVKQL